MAVSTSILRLPSSPLYINHKGGGNKNILFICPPKIGPLQILKLSMNPQRNNLLRPPSPSSCLPVVLLNLTPPSVIPNPQHKQTPRPRKRSVSLYSTRIDLSACLPVQITL